MIINTCQEGCLERWSSEWNWSHYRNPTSCCLRIMSDAGSRDELEEQDTWIKIRMWTSKKEHAATPGKGWRPGEGGINRCL